MRILNITFEFIANAFEFVAFTLIQRLIIALWGIIKFDDPILFILMVENKIGLDRDLQSNAYCN